jgi:hypothetical protein
LPPSRKRKKEGKNERFIDFNFDPCRMVHCASLVAAAFGDFYVNEAGLSGRGQEEQT